MRNRASLGFSLVEMLAVLGIAGMLVATSSAALSQALPVWRARQAAMDVATSLRAARARALLEHTETLMPFDTERGRYTLLTRSGPDRIETAGGDKIARLPQGVEFAGPGSETPVTLDPPGSETESAQFTSKGMLRSDSIPGYVHVGVPSRQLYWRVAVNSIGIVKLERWIGGRWQ